MADQNGGARYKVGRLIAEYDLAGVGRELEARWTRSEDRYGLRRLADYFNRELVRATISGDGAELLEGEAENVYRLLTDEGVGSGVRTRTRNSLERRGVDVDKLEDDFVSYQSIYTYLTGHRGASPPDDTPQGDRLERKNETIQRLKTRLAAVTERSLAELVGDGRLSPGDYDVLVTVRVQCADCNTRRPVSELLARGGCECGGTESP